MDYVMVVGVLVVGMIIGMPIGFAIDDFRDRKHKSTVPHPASAEND